MLPPHDIYAPPQAALETAPDKTPMFYVVASRKFLVLFAATLGLYGYYWIYRNWWLYKRSLRLDIWPIPRALFSIFFVHALFRDIDARLRNSGLLHQWSAQHLATSYVVLEILSNITNRLSFKGIGSPITDVVAYLFTAAVGAVLWQAQRAINIAENDPRGQSNNSFSIANIAWIGLGLVFWVLTIIGILLPGDL